MPELPVFQRLPLHIAEKILRYRHSPGSWNDSPGPDKYRPMIPALIILYDVSYSWRVIALQHFLRELVIRVVINERTGRFGFRYLPDRMKKLCPIDYNYVKQIVIEFPESRAKPYKTPARDLSTVWPESLVFNSARSLSIELAVLNYQEFDEHGSSDRDERFFWITQRIQSSMPQLQNVLLYDTRFIDMHGKDASGQQWKADKFMSTVFSKVKALSIVMNAVVLVSDFSFIQGGTGLTSLNWLSHKKNELFSLITEKSAATLLSMNIRDSRLNNIRSLVFDRTGMPIVYPRLQTVEFSGGGDNVLSERFLVDKSTVPFPALRTLIWQSIYVFDDDTLFRGNGDTLESICMDLDANLARIQKKCNMFAAGKYLQLRSVALANSGYYYSTSLSPVEFVGFATCLITPAVRSVLLSHDFSGINTIHSLAAAPKAKQIRHLNITVETGTLSDLLELVKMLLNMVQLQGISEIDTIDGNDSSFVNDLYSRYYPLSHSLRSWDGIYDMSDTVEATAKAAIILAILCPNFVAARTFPYNKGNLRNAINSAIGSGIYDEHRDKIQRFLRVY